MVWLLIIEVLLLLMAILFFTLKLSWLSSFAIVMMIFFPTCYMSCALYGVIEDNIAPGIVYGKERAKAEDIKLINRKGGKYTFSNGETVKVPKSNALIIYPGLGFF